MEPILGKLLGLLDVMNAMQLPTVFLSPQLVFSFYFGKQLPCLSVCLSVCLFVYVVFGFQTVTKFSLEDKLIWIRVLVIN